MEVADVVLEISKEKMKTYPVLGVDPEAIASPHLPLPCPV